jgi:hypothetical protein
VDPNGKLKPGTIETADLLITITEIGGGSYRILSLDKNKGTVTSIDL